jgi:hypothetical protein
MTRNNSCHRQEHFCLIKCNLRFVLYHTLRTRPFLHHIYFYYYLPILQLSPKTNLTYKSLQHLQISLRQYHTPISSTPRGVQHSILIKPCYNRTPTPVGIRTSLAMIKLSTQFSCTKFGTNFHILMRYYCLLRFMMLLLQMLPFQMVMFKLLLIKY